MNKLQTCKRLLSILLCAVLVLGSFPVTARAAEAPATLYLTPGSDWAQANARFAAYFFGNGDTWGDMTDADGDGTYEVAVPSGYTSVIFVRMNPATTVNSWDSKWNQTVDLTVPTDGTNCFTIESPWSDGGATGSWTTYTYVEPVFIIAGSEGLCGTAWDTANTDNQMTQNSEGLYEKTYENVAVGTYELKVTGNGSWYGNSDGSNVAVEVTEEGSTVTVTFDAATKAVTVTVTAPEVEDTTPFIEGMYITVDGVKHESSTAENPVVINSDATVTVTVYGKNFENLPPYSGDLQNAFAYFGSNFSYLFKNASTWDIDTANSIATCEASMEIMAKATTAMELLYTNDKNVTTQGSGIYVIYNLVTYSVSIAQTSGGIVTADVATAEEGDTVNLTVTPDEGYTLYKLTVTDADGAAVPVYPGSIPLAESDTAVTTPDAVFSMPDSEVTVTAVFVEPDAIPGTVYFDNSTASLTEPAAIFLDPYGQAVDLCDLTFVEGNILSATVPAGASAVLFISEAEEWYSAELWLPLDGKNLFTPGSEADAYGQYPGTWSVYTSGGAETAPTLPNPLYIATDMSSPLIKFSDANKNGLGTATYLTPVSDGIWSFTGTVPEGARYFRVYDTNGSDYSVEIISTGLKNQYNTADRTWSVYTPAEEDTTATITGVGLVVDEIEYTSGNVTITPDSTVILAAFGTNLQNGTEDNVICYAPDVFVPVTTDGFTVYPDGSIAFIESPSSAFELCSNFELLYCNDATGDQNIISTGIFVTYDGGTGEGGDDTTVDVDLSDGIINDVAELKAALKAGGSYTLGNDITLMENVDVYADTVLDLGGYTITMEAEPEGFPWGRVSVADPYETPSPCALTLKNGSVACDAGDISLYRGSLTVESGSYEHITVYADEGDAVLNLKGGTVGTVEVMQYEGATARVNMSGTASVQKWMIEGGIFDFDPTDYLYAGYKAVEADNLWTVELDTASVTPTGETFRVYFNNWLDAPEYGYVGYYFYVENSEDPSDGSVSAEDIVVELLDFTDENGDCLTFPMTRSTEDDKVWYVDLDTAYQNARFDFYSESGGSTLTIALPRQGSMIYDPTDDAWSAYTAADTTATITGVSITVDGTPYTSGNVTITPDSTVTITVTGTNLQNGTNDNAVNVAYGVGLTLSYFTVSADGTTATLSASASWFANSSNYEIKYYNNYTDSSNRTAVNTGIFVTYDDTPAEPTTVTLYCINSTGWSTVSAYAWTDDSIPTPWPGAAMTKTGETVNGFDVYSVTFDTAYENLIFNNNNNGSQTNALYFQAGQYYDLKTSTWYESLEDVPVVDPLATDCYLTGSFNGWSTLANEFKLDAAGGTVGYISLELEANTTYEFKIVREGTWTSCATPITGDATGLAFRASVENNATITTTEAGIYVFAFDTGNSQLAVTYPEAEGPFDILYSSMTMGNSLAMNFAFGQDNRTDWTGCYAEIRKTYADGRDDVTQTVAFENWSSVYLRDGGCYYVTFNGIAAKEMTDDVYITVYDADGNAISNTFIDSVRAHAMRNLALDTITDLEKTMVVDMLNYGAAAQEYFSYNTSDLANAQLSEEQKALATESTSYEDTRTGSGAYVASNLMLKSNIQLMFAFRDVTTDMQAVITFTDHHGTEKNITVEGTDFTKNGSFYVVTVEDMVVADSRQDITCTVYDADGNIVGEATDSVESYTARKGDTLFAYLMKFSDSAHAFFHQ